MIKKGLSLLLAILFILPLLASCQKTPAGSDSGKDPYSPFDPSIEQGDWELPDDSSMPDPTPAKDPANGVKVSYRCEPSYAGTIDGKGTQYIVPGGYTETVVAMPLYGYRFVCWSDGSTSRARPTDKVEEDTVLTATFEPVEVPYRVTVAQVHLNTANGDDIKSKNYVDATISISGADKDKHNVEALATRVKGRGNSTWSTSYIGKEIGDVRWSSTKKEFHTVSSTDAYASKNSYTLKLSEGLNVLGIGDGKNKDWVLQSNKYDLTMLRNWFMWSLANRMGTFNFVPSCAFVDLYVNGEYRGVYMIVEKVEAASERVNIDDSGTDPDKGYLLELDFRVNKDSSKKEGLDYFLIPGFHEDDANKREFDILSDHSTEEECAFIKDYMTKVHNAIISGDRGEIEKLVDLYSMVDIFIIEELGKDCDWGATSFYMCKEKGGKLYFTAPWDFDFCMGSYSSGIHEEGLISAGSYGNEWFEAVHDLPWFVELVRARMNSLEDDITELTADLQKMALALKPHAERNNEKWDVFGVGYHEFVSPQVSSLLATYDEHVAFIYDWILYRWNIIREWYPILETSSSPFYSG
ncbi:MAG: CotH kinase family protein [Clostridia bacterium]|nr:CotH kinase family protein [Clostridia bacterium]